MNPNMNSNACTDTTTFAQYMENNLHLCYVNLFPHFPKNDGKAFDEPVLLSIKNAIKLFGNYRLIQIKTYGTYFYFQLEMED